MLKYLKSSEVSMRVGLNPFNWVWIPSVAYDKPTAMYPKRKTFAFAFLFLQMYLDLDDGTFDGGKLAELFAQRMDAIEQDA